MSPSLDFLVPVSISVVSSQASSHLQKQQQQQQQHQRQDQQQQPQQQQQQQQQPSINEQPLVESISWALINKATKRTEWTRTSCLAAQSVLARSQDPVNAAALSEAIKQVSIRGQCHRDD